MNTGITGFDHVLIGVADLEQARDVWARLGFTVTPRGSHIGWGTANYCIMFPHDYIELLGIVDPSQFTNNLDRFLAQRGQGLLAVAFASADADETHAALRPRGLSVVASELVRRLELPEGSQLPRFRLVHFASGATPALNAFICQHLTPELMQRREWLRHDNCAIALEGVTISADRPEEMADAYRRLFGPEAVTVGSGRLDVSVGPHVIRFLSPGRLHRRYTGIALTHETPVAMVLTVKVADLLATRRYLSETGIPLVPIGGLRLVVPPDQATGVIVEFVVH